MISLDNEELCLAMLPSSCPYTISKLDADNGVDSKTWLIREHDQYGEYPHIYAKICRATRESMPQTRGLSGDTKLKSADLGRDQDEKDEKRYDEVIILSDTGCGTEVPYPTSHHACAVEHAGSSMLSSRPEPAVWNLGTFLEYTLNPAGRIPYLVMTTHCHYDHIMGLWKLPPTTTTRLQVQDRVSISPRLRPDGASISPPVGRADGRDDVQMSNMPATTVLSSSHGKSFVIPYANLQRHSLCENNGLQAPNYTVSVWADDMQRVVYSTPASLRSIPTPLTILHMPGHTPDSLAWYDADTHMLCVGDSFYLKETPTTRAAPWGPEPAMPTIFTLESDLADWWTSARKVLAFVREKNAELKWQRWDGARRGGEDDCFVFVEYAGVSDGDRDPRFRDAIEPGLESGSPVPEFAHEHQEGNHDDDWVLVDIAHRSSSPSAPERVSLCAAHTTVSVDAEAATLTVLSFMARILRDEVPCRRVADGSGGEERWLWDYALNRDSAVSVPFQNEDDKSRYWHHGENDRKDQNGRKDKTQYQGHHEISECKDSWAVKASKSLNLDQRWNSRGFPIQDVQSQRQGQGHPSGNNGYVDGSGYERHLRYEYSVLAPLCVVEEGRRTIPRSEWDVFCERAV
ncbi:hypothetical protein A1O1_04230 [Capronia coronata CBS 617.96]|uniref:Metallo-beta-lactamase domain-containing protein n=1 Tax=Capronia coronata CBS 617.96 TaxID=1182541 RepID=W9YEZ3_9EURO|nr:uncharacterized protein A1O1_04230 [Capronia coronata CBS 617.96]EXJ91123.1 hypothetical protein A1O1_04230 [Capronia coronata CBS 617.96]